MLRVAPLLLPFAYAGYESYCEQNDLTIKIPYTNAKTADLLNFSAGSCSNHGASSLIHTYSYNATAQQAVFTVKIDECNLDDGASNEDDGAGGERSSFSAIANITLGANDNGQDLVFYNALLGAQCGETTDYTVTFTYASDIDISGDVDCEEDENGNCVIPAYNRYTFAITEYESNAYVNPVTEETRQNVANEPIYLKLTSDDLPGHKKFGVKRCFVHHDNNANSYELFNPSSGSCSNDFIDLKFEYDIAYSNGELKTEARIEHQLFLLGQGNSDQTYYLSCEVKVCDRSDSSSECNAWTNCLSDENALEYVCDSNTCADGENCAVSKDADNNNSASCSAN